MKLEDLTETKTVWVIKDPSSKEFRVPSADGREEGAYYTDNKDDAIGTIKNFMYKGKNVVIKFKSGKHPT